MSSHKYHTDIETKRSQTLITIPVIVIPERSSSLPHGKPTPRSLRRIAGRDSLRALANSSTADTTPPRSKSGPVRPAHQFAHGRRYTYQELVPEPLRPARKPCERIYNGQMGVVYEVSVRTNVAGMNVSTAERERGYGSRLMTVGAGFLDSARSSPEALVEYYEYMAKYGGTLDEVHLPRDWNNPVTVSLRKRF